MSQLLVVPPPASAEVELHGESVPSFNESQGCGTLEGFRGPYVTQSGSQPNSEPIYGPWGNFFGRDFGELRDHLVLWTVPESGGRSLWVHEWALPAFEQVEAALAAAKSQGLTYDITQSSSFNPRTIAGGFNLSLHSVANAIDFNWDTNPFRSDNVFISDMPAWFVQIWRDAGFCWGGDWQTIKVTMHFSWKGPLATPGYGLTPVPMPPRTAFEAFVSEVWAAPTALGERQGWTHLVEDADRDGAPDLGLPAGSGFVVLERLQKPVHPRARHRHHRKRL